MADSGNEPPGNETNFLELTAEEARQMEMLEEWLD